MTTAQPRPAFHRDDHEFLPAALEVLETPPSPVKMALTLMICALVVLTLTWAYIGRIDIFAVAPGKIRPTELVKTVQPRENGRIIALMAKNGMVVDAGAVLVQMDKAELQADDASVSATFASARAESLRRNAAIRAAETDPFAVTDAIDWPENVPAIIREREERVLQNDLAGLSTTLKGLSLRRQQKQVEIERLAATIAAQQRMVDTLKQRVDMRSALEANKSGSRASVLDALEGLQQQETTLAAQLGQKDEAEAGLAVLASEEARLRAQFIAENSQKLTDAERQADEFEQRLAKIRVRLDNATLTSPIAGTVQGVSVTTIGQVVSAGQELMRIVPLTNALEIEAYAENRDVGFIREGQEAIIKVESFPFIRYGALNGTVTHVAKDSIPAPDVQRIDSDPTQANRAQPTFAGAKPTQNLVYAVTVKPDATTIDADGLKAPLSPGMSVTVEIKTGSRRILEYIFSPLVQTVAESMRER